MAELEVEPFENRDLLTLVPTPSMQKIKKCTGLTRTNTAIMQKGISLLSSAGALIYRKLQLLKRLVQEIKIT